MQRRRLILLLDGTWNDSESGEAETNIVRLRTKISREIKEASQGQGSEPGGFEYRIFYERGVGTSSAFDRLTGGAFGFGLDTNIRSAYRFLSSHFRPGDEIFIFGFSRGAYTARSLCGYIATTGLLRPQYCVPEQEAAAWSLYKAGKNDRSPGLLQRLEPYTFPLEDTQIQCLGVFDTVGALGIPLRPFWRGNRERYQFHDVELSPIVKVNLHAMAIDEHRAPFASSAWRESLDVTFSSLTEQVWFPGAHADVGGGYVRVEDRTSIWRSLDEISLKWMMQRVKFHYSDFPLTLEAPEPEDTRDILVKSQQHEPRYWLLPFAWRTMFDELPVRRPLHYETAVSYDSCFKTVNEMIHIAALERIGEIVLVEDVPSIYAPYNLVKALKKMRSSGSTAYIVVDWSGFPVSLNDPIVCKLLDRISKLPKCSVGWP